MTGLVRTLAGNEQARANGALLRRLRASMHWPIAGAILLIGGLTFVTKLAVVAKDATLAHFFGTSDALDAFLIAFLLPSFAVNVIAGSLQVAFLPAYVRLRDREGHAAAAALQANVMGWAIFMLIVATAACAVVGAPLMGILGAGFNTEKLALTRHLFYLLLPTLLLAGLSTIWAATLNAWERFATVAAAPVMTPLFTVALLLLTGRAWGIHAVALAALLGATAEAALIARGLARHGWLAWPSLRFTPELREVMQQFVPMFAAAIMMSSTTIIDQSMAAWLGPGSVSALNYGSRIITGVLGISAVALGTAVFPHFAKRLAARDPRGATGILKAYSTLIAGLSIPVMLVLVLASEPLVRLLFERGNFTAQDTQLVGRIQALYALQLPFYLVGLLGVRFISSLQGNGTLLLITAVSLIANVGGNLFFMRWFGVAGIALSTSVVYLISCAMILIAVHWLLKNESHRFQT